MRERVSAKFRVASAAKAGVALIRGALRRESFAAPMGGGRVAGPVAGHGEDNAVGAFCLQIRLISLTQAY